MNQPLARQHTATVQHLPHQLRLAVRINDACAALGISRSSLYELVAAGKIKTILIAGRRVIPVSELERVISEGMSDAL